MFYEERVIDGVLCRRGLPNEPFRAFTAEQLTALLLSERKARIEAQLASCHE